MLQRRGMAALIPNSNTITFFLAAFGTKLGSVSTHNFLLNMSYQMVNLPNLNVFRRTSNPTCLQPPRFSRIYHIQVKAYKLTVMLSGVEPGTLISELKSDTLSAIKSDVAQNSLDITAMEPPEIDVETEEDFELCRAVKERGKPTGKYEILPSTKAVRDHGLAGWDTLYLQFRDRSTGKQTDIPFVMLPYCLSTYSYFRHENVV